LEQIDTKSFENVLMHRLPRLATNLKTDSQIRRNEPTSELRKLKRKPKTVSKRLTNEPTTFLLEQKNA